MNLRTLLTIFALPLFVVGCAGAPEGTVAAFSTRGGTGGGGSGGVTGPGFGRDICSIPEPGPIDLDTSWDGKSDLWGDRRGVVIAIKAKDGWLGYLGIDPVANQLVWYGISQSNRYDQLQAMPGSCQLDSSGHHGGPVINQATVGRLPQTPPQGGGEKRMWTFVDCDLLREYAAAASTDLNSCHY